MTTTELGAFGDRRSHDHAVRLGMWVFLGSETLLFAALFGLYVAYRALYGAEFTEAAGHSAALLGTVNTVILITSSFTVALAVDAARHVHGRRVSLFIVLTLCLGGAFLGLKGLEYADHLAHGIAPGRAYSFAELPADGAKLFFTLYYLMTGLHALHVIAGMVALGVLAWRYSRNPSNKSSHLGIELGGLYWHLVDAVWIFLWPIFYLMR